MKKEVAKAMVAVVTVTVEAAKAMEAVAKEMVAVVVVMARVSRLHRSSRDDAGCCRASVCRSNRSPPSSTGRCSCTHYPCTAAPASGC